MRLAQTALLLVAMFALPAAAQSTWYVDVHATPPGNGSAASPYTSIQYAYDQPTTLKDHKIVVAPGLYVENFKDAPFKRVWIQASAGPTVTELRPLVPTEATVQLIAGSEIRGFTLSGNVLAGPENGALNLNPGYAVQCILRDNVSSVRAVGGSVLRCTIIGGDITVVCNGGLTMWNTIHTGSFTLPCFPNSGTSLSYCAGPDLHPLHSGVGNIKGDPGMWNVPGAEHLLAPGSPCIDAGEPFGPPDPDGSPMDIGAIPFDPDFNPFPTVYCTAKTTSQGCVPAIGFQGMATFEGEVPFVVSASQVHSTAPGLLFYGPGAHFLPFQGAWHCVEFPTPRVGGQAAAGSGLCGGTYSFDFAAHLAAGAHEFVTPGAQLACQWWSRDTEDPTGFGTTLTDALLFSVVP
jgi:hypothetical protein